MSTPAISNGRSQAVARLKTLTNSELKEICRTEHLTVSGVKAQLQARIIEHMDRAINGNSTEMFERVRGKINNRGAAAPPQYQNTGYNSSSTPAYQQHRPQGFGAMNGENMASGYPRPNLPPPTGPRAAAHARMTFKPSPFYIIQEPMSPIGDLIEMPQNRHQINYPIVLNESTAQLLKEDTSLKLMLYCTTLSILGQYDLCEVAFPSQMDVRINSDEVKHNFKGLKNKPGTTKPADLTSYVRKVPRYNNIMHINYALTSKRYSWIVNLVRKASAEELTEKVRNNRVISKESVLREMISKAKDPDIIATSSVMSLKDPISTMRMELPCRSTLCKHNQCFDVSCFIQLQEQAPTWACPICNKTISYEALAIDEYVLDILQNTSKSVEQVTIEPEGSWSEIKQDDSKETGKPASQARATYDEDSEDELVEISGPKGGGVAIKTDAVHSSSAGLAQHTPPLSSRETSAPQTSSSRAGSKRPSTIIDLTLSDEDEPPRQVKRPAVNSYNTPASMTDFRNPHSGLQQLPPNPTPSPFTLPLLNLTSSPANGGAPQVPTGSEGSRQTLPWPQQYASFGGSPWSIPRGDQQGMGQAPR